MQKWEYLRVTTKPSGSDGYGNGPFKVETVNGKKIPAEDFDHYLSALGEQGWELVVVAQKGDTGVGYATWIFKRPKPDHP